jgi:hypothetical protein
LKPTNKKDFSTHVKKSQKSLFALSTLALPSSDHKGQGENLSQQMRPWLISIIFFFRKNTNIFYKTFFPSFFINKCYNKRELREDKKNGKNYCSECW